MENRLHHPRTLAALYARLVGPHLDADLRDELRRILDACNDRVNSP